MKDCSERLPPPGSDCEPAEQKKIPEVNDFNPAVDTVKIDNLSDCGDPQGADNLGDSDLDLIAWKDYCESSLPNSTQKQRIRDALDRIEERGEVCAEIAQRARSYLSNNLIYIDPEAQRAGGWGFRGLVIIWEAYANRFHDDRTKEDAGYARDGNLESILVHEFDHVMGEDGHEGRGIRTSHELQCSNL